MLTVSSIASPYDLKMLQCASMVLKTQIPKKRQMSCLQRQNVSMLYFISESSQFTVDFFAQSSFESEHATNTPQSCVILRFDKSASSGILGFFAPNPEHLGAALF